MDEDEEEDGAFVMYAGCYTVHQRPTHTPNFVGATLRMHWETIS
jgi:hypothetical protein